MKINHCTGTLEPTMIKPVINNLYSVQFFLTKHENILYLLDAKYTNSYSILPECELYIFCTPYAF